MKGSKTADLGLAQIARKELGVWRPTVKLENAWLGFSSWSPLQLLCEGVVQIDGIAMRVDLDLKAVGKAWRSDMWRVRSVDFDPAAYYTKDAEGKIISIDFDRMNADEERRMPRTVTDKAYRLVLRTSRE
jgi:hypothetical protein